MQKTSQFWTMYFYKKKIQKKFLARKIKGHLTVEFMAFIYKYFFFDFARDCIDWVKKKKFQVSHLKKYIYILFTVLNSMKMKL